MNSLFLARLRALTPLRADDLDALAQLFSDERALASEHQLVTEGARPRRLHIVAEGWAARVKLLRDGSRHLCGLMIPGDLCDVDGLHLQCYDYGVVALTPCRVVSIERGALLALCDRRPAIAHTLTWLGFVDNSILNEAATSLARRSARRRVAHLLCELRLRLEVIGRAEPDGYALPLTQEKIADALGLTAVHVNRTFRELRHAGLVTVAGQRLTVPDWRALESEAGFSPGYLHLEGMHRLAA